MVIGHGRKAFERHETRGENIYAEISNHWQIVQVAMITVKMYRSLDTFLYICATFRFFVSL